jgi:cysteine protease ATG4
VHRKPLPGEELGQRLGASTSTGAIQAIVGVFPVTGIGVAVALDGTLYPSEFFSASFSLPGRTRVQA